MRNLFIFIALFISVTLMAQTPASFNYQAVVRDASGDEVANQKVSFRISILEGSETGTPIYVETHSVTTNEFGLANLAVGEGTAETGTLSPKGWGNQPHYLKVELDPEGGTSYQHLGTSPLLAVPYAFHAETVSQDAVNDDDADPANEIQSLSLSGSDLSLSDGGGTVTLPSGGADLWMENGNSLYTENNSVGIGTDNPTQNLDVLGNAASMLLRSTGTGFGFDGDAFIMLDKSLDSKNANLNLQSAGNTQFYAGLLGSNDFRISTDISSLNGLEVQQDGDVAASGDMAVGGDMTVNGETHTESTGEANMTPIAYGMMRYGNLAVSSGNLQVEEVQTGMYDVTVNGEVLHENFVVNVTPMNDAGHVWVDDPLSSKITIFTTDKSGSGVNANFMFVIYMP